MRHSCSIQQVVQRHLCISCGACVSAAPAGSMEMVLDEQRGIFAPRVVDMTRVTGKGIELDVCPGRGYPIAALGRELYGSAAHNTFELGRYRAAIATHMTDERIREQAASGGVMTGITLHLLEKKLVAGVIVSRFVYGGAGPRTEAYIARTLEDLLAAQGSKYCPTDTNRLIQECVESGDRYMFVGTPCQVAGVRLAMRQDARIAEVFPYTMANFCGGYRDFRYLDELLRIHGIEPSAVKHFRFRGGGQPGSLLAITHDGKTASSPYPDYVHRSKIPRQKRCWYCVDATGELADFSCGDAWLPRLLEDEYPWSIILARSPAAEQVVNELVATEQMKVTPITFEEIVYSLRSNLDSKKSRQYKRMRVSRLLGIAIPKWDVELPRGDGTYRKEIRTLIGKTGLGAWLIKIKRLCLRMMGRRSK